MNEHTVRCQEPAVDVAWMRMLFLADGWKSGRLVPCVKNLAEAPLGDLRRHGTCCALYRESGRATLGSKLCNWSFREFRYIQTPAVHITGGPDAVTSLRGHTIIPEPPGMIDCNARCSFRDTRQNLIYLSIVVSLPAVEVEGSPKEA